jgi:hypothetical protein
MFGPTLDCVAQISCHLLLLRPLVVEQALLLRPLFVVVVVLVFVTRPLRQLWACACIAIARAAMGYVKRL